MGGIVGIADRAQDQAGMGAAQEPGDGDQRREREIDQRILAEQDRADHRQCGKAGNGELGQGLQRLADIAGADQRREADTEDGERQSGRDLIGQQGQGQHGEDQRHRRAGERRRDDAEHGAAGAERHREADDGAHEHHALDAEIEHARFLGDELAGRGQQQRRRGGDHRQRHRGDQRELVHAAPPAGTRFTRRMR